MGDEIEGGCESSAGQLTGRFARDFVWENQKSYATRSIHVGIKPKVNMKVVNFIRDRNITSETNISLVMICYAHYQFFLCSSQNFRRRDVVRINASVASPISYRHALGLAPRRLFTAGMSSVVVVAIS
jgi:hypothetical protein